MKKIIIVLIILVGNFVNLYYMGQNAEKESEQELSVTNFENVRKTAGFITPSVPFAERRIIPMNLPLEDHLYFSIQSLLVSCPF